MEILRKISRTKDGRRMEIACYEPPLDEELAKKIDAISPMRLPWKTSWDLRLAGNLIKECRDRFIVAIIGKEIVSRMWYTVSGDFASLGSVFTAESYRGQGISSQLLKTTLRLLDDEEGLSATYLGVSKPIPRALYGKAGWVPYNDAPGTCIMRRFKNDKDILDFDRDYFSAKGPFSVKNGSPADLPGLEALYNLMLPDTWFGRNWLHGIYKNVAAECQIDAMFNEADTGDVAILEDTRKRMLGVAFDRRGGPFCRHNMELDLFIAPGALDGGCKLIEYTLSLPLSRQSETIIVYSSESDYAKNELLRSEGFTQGCRLKRYFSFQDKFYDCLVLVKER
jgi:GNAT superfamily N-acetyltransferase